MNPDRTYGERAARRRQLGAGGAAIAVHLVVAAVLLIGWTVTTMPATRQPIMLDLLIPSPPPVTVLPPRSRPSTRREGAASPPNLRARATEIELPRPIVPLVVPPTIAAATVAGKGTDAVQGNADITGPGTGSGGVGNGTGSGGYGDGDGDGGVEVPPRLRRGRLKNSDYPASAGDAGVGGTVSVRYQVRTDGRVGACRITRSSGNPDLDATTCRLIVERFRFDPSRDAQGRPVAADIVEDHDWQIARLPPEN